MKHQLLITLCLVAGLVSAAQYQGNSSTALERSAEIITDKAGAELEDDSFLIQLDNFRKHPLNLNYATEADLKELLLLNDLQIENFLRYRRLLGTLLDRYELQAIPSWNLRTIQQLLPFTTISQQESFLNNMKERWSSGSHNVLVRTSRVLEKSAGYLTEPDSGSHYLGNANRLMIRYNYNYRNLLQWGVLGDKDAGEQFLRGKQKAGFDFYSFHLFISKLRAVKFLALGDFTVNMGQGLIQWQGLSFNKTADVSTVKKQSAVLRPYTAAGEVNFHRGAGITLQNGRWEATIFASYRMLSGNLVKDSVNDKGHISSFLISGYNRTTNELEDRNNFQQFSGGAALKYSTDNWHVAVNAVQFKFSYPYQKEDKPYNLFSASGKKFGNESIDYSYTYKNSHLFGELAVDKYLNKALLHGLLMSLTPAVDLSMVFRSISRRYQSFNADAFTENGNPVNARGLFAGLCLRPSDLVQINAYADVYRFPWLKYRVDAASSGREYFLQVHYKPSKQVEVYTYFSNETKQQNISNSTLTMGTPENTNRQNWRINSTIALSPVVTFRSRVETLFYNKMKPGEEEGFLLFADILLKPPLKNWSANMRLLYFETGGYNSRFYTFENDMLYNFSIPVIFEKGFRYYINARFDISTSMKKLFSIKIKTECWVKAAQTFYSGKKSSGQVQI